MVIGTRSGQKHVGVHDSDVVFVGYGVDAPEQQWNDYAGLDVKGQDGRHPRQRPGVPCERCVVVRRAPHDLVRALGLQVRRSRAQRARRRR
jgi:hypothetical protein